jgi:hypothetical protein
MTPPPARQPPPFAAPAKLEDSTTDSAQPLWNLQTNKVAPASFSSFGHEPAYQWLRGVISRDPQDGRWSIVYSDDPDAADKYAGHLPLAPSPELEQLKDGDVVELRGKLDDLVKDALGKPTYVIADLQRLSAGNK